MTALADAAARALHAPGIYVFLGPERELLYIGKAADLRRRLGDHARDQTRTGELRRQVLLRAVRTIHWEQWPDEESASIREADLIVMLKPRFNAAHAEQVTDHYLNVTLGRGSAELVLAAGPTPGGRAYGTFPHLAKGAYSPLAKRTKCGYTAFLRLLWTAGSPSRSARIPTRIAASSPPRQIAAGIAPQSNAQLHDFLSGRSMRLVPALRTAIAAIDMPAFTRAALERDVDAAVDFFELGPRRVRQFRLRHGLAPGPVSGPVMAELLAQELRGMIGEFRRDAVHADPSLGRHAARGRELRERQLSSPPGPVPG